MNKEYDTIKVYYCSNCPRVYTKDIECPMHNTTNKEIGWVQHERQILQQM
jgi:RNA polymerase subunit RPABC4/transcription elongation factor Spt4